MRAPIHQRRRRHGERAFSLVEMAITVTVLGILVGVSYNGIENIRARTTSRNGVQAVVTAMQRARAECFSRGAPVVFFARTYGTDGFDYGVIADYDSDFDPANIDTSLADVGNGTDPAKPDRELLRTKIDRGIYFRRTGAPVFASPLPAPFDTVPANSPCTFCSSPSGPVVVVFRTDGTARLGTTPATAPIGGSFALVAVDPRKARPTSDTNATQMQTIAVLSRAGTVQVYDR